jgi:predicted RNase H-like HicB family nuclease
MPLSTQPGCGAHPGDGSGDSWTPHEPASTVFPMAASIDFTIAFESPDEDGWIVARILEVPGAMSQGRTRGEARANALDALGTVLAPDEALAGGAPQADREHLRFIAAP